MHITVRFRAIDPFGQLLEEGTHRAYTVGAARQELLVSFPAGTHLTVEVVG